MAGDSNSENNGNQTLGTLPAGVQLRHYMLISVLGQGSFGITYLARDTVLGRKVAIKEYLPIDWALRTGGATVEPRSTKHAANFIWGRERFLEEARILATLDDVPEVVHVHEFMEANGTAYMVMGLVPGETLEERLKRHGCLPASIVERMFSRLLDGLQQVHRAGFMHCDIKPANIILDASDNPTLIDFGAAREAMVERTVTMRSAYTPRYAAAEQFTLSRQGPWTDIYCVSASLYHAITGDAPPASVERMEEDTYKALCELAPAGFSQALLKGIDAGLAVWAKDRPQSIASWRHELTAATGSGSTVVASPRPSREPQASAGPDIEARPAPSGTPSSPVAPRPPQRHAGSWVRFAAVMLILLGANAYVAFAPRGPDPAQDKVKLEAEEEARQKKQAEEEARQQKQAEDELAKRRAEQEEAKRQEKLAEAKQRAEAEARARQWVSKDCSQCPEMVSIPLGSFLMGVPPGEEEREKVPQVLSGRAKPQRWVTVSQPFSIGKHEVTRGQYEAFTTATGHAAGSSCQGFGSDGKWTDKQGVSWRNPGFAQTDSDPVVCISWNDAKAYVEWLSDMTRKRYRLPSETEWEYSARAGTTESRYWGDHRAQACRFANVSDRTMVQKFNWQDNPDRVFQCTDNYAYTAPVGSFQANPWGLHDMLGNVWEWVEDCWNDSYEGAPLTQGAKTLGKDCGDRVTRGGGWDYHPHGVRAANRTAQSLNSRDHNTGFRVARSD